MVVLCLAGGVGEENICGGSSSPGDQQDIDQARAILTKKFGPLQIGAELKRLRGAAEWLVRSERRRIIALANALLKSETLTGAQIQTLIEQH